LFGGEVGQGFAALAAFDSNQDGVVDAQDIRFNELRIWQDSNSNHATDAGELRSLSDHGIASLNLRFVIKPTMQNGNQLIEHAQATTTQGKTMEMVDAYFQVEKTDGRMEAEGKVNSTSLNKPVPLPPEPDNSARIIVRSVLRQEERQERAIPRLLPRMRRDEWNHMPPPNDKSMPAIDWGKSSFGLPMDFSDESEDLKAKRRHRLWLNDFLQVGKKAGQDLVKQTGLKVSLNK
ncbi:MAG: hypothetical protein JF616_00035, partial [Fibrobacteres bacterium]|nr:hypothetical protein [Fibrobacterota bacterium]